MVECLNIQEYSCTMDTAEATPERCSHCPHPTDRFQNPPLPHNPPLTMFSCGHAVHTQCILINMYHSDRNILHMSCLTCNEPFISPEVQNHLRTTFRDTAPDRIRHHVNTLWETNEVFREQVREAAKLERDVIKKQGVVKKEIAILKKEWKDNTMMYNTILKNMREAYIRRFREIKGKREVTAAIGKAHRAKHLLCDTYDFGLYELEEINRIRGAPKIGRTSRRMRRWRMNPDYIFRFRLKN